MFKQCLDKVNLLNQGWYFVVFIFLMGIMVISIPTSFASQAIESPLKQMQKGVLAKDVVCQTGLKLILKIEDGKAACVKSDTFDKLIGRGWGMANQTVTPPPVNQTVTPPMASNNTVSPSGIHLAFLTLGSPDNIPILENNLNPGDYIFVNTPLGADSKASAILQEAADIKSKVKPGVHVYTVIWYSKIADIESRVPNLPKGIDYIIYDFEIGPNFTPEYTTDQQQADALFDRALKVAHDNGLKLMVTPTYGAIQNGGAVSRGWDWGEVATHMDALTIQFQGYYLLSNADTISDDMAHMIKDISKKSPNTVTFVQLAMTPSKGTAEENVNAVHTLNGKGINQFLIFFAGPQQAQYLQDFISKYQSH